MKSREDQPGDAGAGAQRKPRLAAVHAAKRLQRDRYRRSIALLPNLITTGAMFSGFYAIVAAMNGRFAAAGVAVYVAMFLDAADGRVARMTSSESAFGAQYDSLSDLVAFGVAPALVAFSWALSGLGKAGWVVTFIYMACAALRLARFNAAASEDHSSFTGLPSPAAAALIASSVWLWSEAAGASPGTVPQAGTAAVALAAGLLMVSNYKYVSLEVVNFRDRVPFLTLVAVALGFAIVVADPPRVLLVVFGAYALSGPARHHWRQIRRQPKSARNERARNEKDGGEETEAGGHRG